jgi:lipopolysaccharide transport system permease protein
VTPSVSAIGARRHSASPLALIRLVRQRAGLIGDLTRRDALGRYKNSFLGVFWSLVTPMVMLVVYTFVFSTVFNVRWSGGTGSKTEFAAILFAGLTVFNIFAECMTRAPQAIVGNANLVKKVVFPLEVLPLVTLLSALVHAAIAFVILFLFRIAFGGGVPLTVVLLPIVLLPFCLFVLGLTWFFSALAVYVRDVAQTITVVVTVLMFLSPLFFPPNALPEAWRFLVVINPLAQPIEQVRQLVIWGQWPDAAGVLQSYLIGAVVGWAGLIWFQRARKGFADVL